MAGELALTAAQIAAVYPDRAEIYDVIAAATIAAGEAVYFDSNGKGNVADANGSGTLQFRGICLRAVTAGQVFPLLKRGHCYGYTVSAINGDTVLYLSDTAGDIATSAGSTTINVGRVVALPDGNNTKVVYIDADWLRTWS